MISNRNVSSEYLRRFFATRMFSRFGSIQKFFNSGWLTLTPTEPELFSNGCRLETCAKLVVAMGIGTTPPLVRAKTVLVVKKSAFVELRVVPLLPVVS